MQKSLYLRINFLGGAHLFTRWFLNLITLVGDTVYYFTANLFFSQELSYLHCTLVGQLLFLRFSWAHLTTAAGWEHLRTKLFTGHFFLGEPLLSMGLILDFLTLQNTSMT